MKVNQEEIKNPSWEQYDQKTKEMIVSLYQAIQNGTGYIVLTNNPDSPVKIWATLPDAVPEMRLLANYLQQGIEAIQKQ